MSGFLDELERELLAAHPRRRRARTRAFAGRAAGMSALLAIIGVAGAFVLSVGREQHSGGTASPPPAQPAPAPQPLPSTAPPSPTEPLPALPPGSIAVLSGTERAGVAAGVATAIRARYEVGYIGKSVRRDGTRTVVFHAPNFKRAAELVAQDLGASLTTMDATARDAGRGAHIVVEVGRDVLGAAAGALHRPGDGAAMGEISALRYAGRTVVTLTPQLERGRHAVWATRTAAAPKFLGFLPQARPARRVAVTFAIDHATHARGILITRQRSSRRPRTPGAGVLVANIPR